MFKLKELIIFSTMGIPPRYFIHHDL